MSAPAPWFTLSVSIPSDFEAARSIQTRIEEALAEFAYADQDVFAIKLALEEAIVNAVKHGNRMDPSKRIHVRSELDGRLCRIEIADEGVGFNPDAVPDPTAPENLERPCGRGLLLIRHYMTEVRFLEAGRVVSMVRHCQGAARGPAACDGNDQDGP